MTSFAAQEPLVSIIIPTFNYAVFLPKAIKSAMDQTYRNIEILVIDDGSSDNTAKITSDIPGVRYFFQANQGLSSARNRGIEKSTGSYLVFLDADDWLETDALEQNLSIIKNKPDIAFVSGNHYFLRAGENRAAPISVAIDAGHYEALLERNYIGMHASVMFQRWVFGEIRYDEKLSACEDYDLYLSICRRYPVIHHNKFIATYYFHSAGLSHNYPLMQKSLKEVLKKQQPYINTPERLTSYARGLAQSKDFYQLF